jgi:hypothetical protein
VHFVHIYIYIHILCVGPFLLHVHKAAGLRACLLMKFLNDFTNILTNILTSIHQRHGIYRMLHNSEQDPIHSKRANGFHD